MRFVKANIEGIAVYIFELDGTYYPAVSYINAALGIASPQLSFMFDQTTLKTAYKEAKEK